MTHADSFLRIWSTTFKGAIYCGNMVITEITLNKTIQYNTKSLIFFITSNIRFLNTPMYVQTLKDMTISLNCISVLLCTLFGRLLWG